MSEPCCCAGCGATESATPLPGEAQLAHRAGTHATFFAAMRARLGELAGRVPAAAGETACCLDEAPRDALAGGADDAATALLDGFACVADVLTFYQERILNEGYLRTATEERSLRELGRLTGYAPRPGAAADVEVAFTVQPGFDGVVPERTKLQSQPRPGKDAQTFETSEALPVRAAWNAMRVRPRSSQRYVQEERMPGQGRQTEPTGRIEIYLRGVEQNVRIGDLVLLEPWKTGGGKRWDPSVDDLYRVIRATADLTRGQTALRLVPAQGPYSRGFWDDLSIGSGLRDLARPTGVKRATAPRPIRGIARARANAQHALGVLRSARDAQRADPDRQEAAPRLRALELSAIRMALRTPGGKQLVAEAMPAPLRSHVLSVLQQTAKPFAPRAFVFRTVAQAFGHNAPKDAKVEVNDGSHVTTLMEKRFAQDERTKEVFLDGDHPRLEKQSRVVVASAAPSDEGAATATLQLVEIVDVARHARSAYQLNGRTTHLTLKEPWRSEPEAPAPQPVPSLRDGPAVFASAPPASAVDVASHTIGPPEITPLRTTLFHVDEEPLVLLPAPASDEVTGSVLRLDGAIEELPPGRRVIVEGEIADRPDLTGVRHAEVAYVAASWIATEDVDDGAEPGPEEPGAPATAIALTAQLSYPYRRESVIVYGNVASASHGETREHVLGSGDAAVPGQTFALRGKPRTWVLDPKQPRGVASTLEVRVNGVLWPEAVSFLDAGPRDEQVVTRTAADGFDRITGGDGKRGARFPTGIENVTARYRVGLGPEGNVAANTIVTLGTKPLGVQSVINPVSARGGALPDDAAAMRARIPIGVRGEDRLVSLRDYEDFALGYAGIEHARAGSGTDALGRPSVRLLVAGAEDAPLELAKLATSLRGLGDAGVRVDVHEARPMRLQLEARVRIDPRRRWDDVASAIRAQLVRELGHPRRAIGRAVTLSEVVLAFHAVPGVVAVDVDAFLPLGSTTPMQPLTIGERARALDDVIARATSPDTERPKARIEVADDALLYVARDTSESIHLTELKP